MYYPYFRGKQNELLTIRETAQLMASRGFIPIIEPVKASLNTLEKALDEVVSAGGGAVVVINPFYGDHSGDGSSIYALLEEKFLADTAIQIGVIFNQNVVADQAYSVYQEYAQHRPVLIHAGFSDPQGLSGQIGHSVAELTHVFFERHCGSVYRKHFKSSNRVIIRDGFEVQNNADYPLNEIFSDLHLTYHDGGFQGFGDFLTVGDVYKEKGGPAYAVAIHVTYINESKENVMYIHHFVSDTNDTPSDPGNKFIEALNKLIKKQTRPNR